MHLAPEQISLYKLLQELPGQWRQALRTITLFEHQKKSFQDLLLAPDDPVLSEIERLNQAQKTELIRIGRHDLSARQYVGVLRAGKLTLQILPKIDYAGNVDSVDGSPAQMEAVRSATQNLLHLLSYTHNLRLYQQQKASLRSQPANWFELLTRLFAEELHQQVKHGINRTYVNIEERLPTIRGTWQIQRQITRPPSARHLFDVAYDEFLANTALNRVFRLVVERLLRLSQDRVNKRLLHDITAWMVDVPLLPHISLLDLDKVQFTRLNERFRSAFNLARLFLESLAPQLVVESQELFAFVFDMNVLFERFVVRFLRRHHRQIFRAPFENLRIVSQASGMRHYLAERIPEGRAVFRLKPDILLMTSEDIVAAIIDTKYKRLDPRQVRLGVAEGDFYQMLAYSVRLECPRTVLLYPSVARDSAMGVDFRVQGREAVIQVATVDLHRPLDQPAQLIENLGHSINSLLREKVYSG